MFIDMWTIMNRDYSGGKPNVFELKSKWQRGELREYKKRGRYVIQSHEGN